MAGDWIKFEHVTPDKPEVDQIAAKLGIDPDAVVGKLARFWIWADQQSISGNALTVTKNLIDRITHAPGFADALINVGWLQARSGSFAIPHFDRHNGQTAKDRAVANRRVAKHRANRNGEIVTNVTPAPLQKPLPEKRREENIDNTTQHACAESADDVARYASSFAMPAPPEAATAFFDTMEANGWTTKQGHPIHDWRAAFRRYLSIWNQREQGRKAPGNGLPAAGESKLEPMEWEK